MLKSIWNYFMCDHDYVVIQEYTVKSQADILIDSGHSPNTHTNFRQKYVTVYKCEKCKRLKNKIVTTADY